MKSFLQSDGWLEFQKKIGRSVFKVQDINVIGHKLPLNKSFLYSPRVSAINDFAGFINKIRTIARQQNAIFFKLEPFDYAHGKLLLLEKFGFVKSNNIQPLQTIILDLTKSEEELLGEMHPKTRYNIKLAEKQAKVQISKSPASTSRGEAGKFQNFDENFEGFWRLMRETAKRDGFHSYSKEYYRKLLEIPGAELFVALIPPSAERATPRVVAANIVLFYGNQAIYLHGASSYEHRNLMAAPLLQWHQILEAKKLGCTEYDFWGIDENKWPGVTRFKRGFCPKACEASSDPNPKGCRGGKEISYPGAYDLVFKPFWYKIYKIAKKIL